VTTAGCAPHPLPNHTDREMTHPLRSSRIVSKTMRTAQMLGEQIVAAGQGSVCRIVFYGSRARGTGSATSDWDFIVVLLDDSPGSEEVTAVGLADDGAEIRLDIWRVAAAEWEASRGLHGHPLRTADMEGVVLYSI
jgi:predicted nucleotidyltransferase